MTSFHRMLVHRAATYFQMDHNLDASGTCVIVNRNKSTRMPERTFFQVMKDLKGLSTRAYSSEEPRKSILKRDYASFEDNQFKVGIVLLLNRQSHCESFTCAKTKVPNPLSNCIFYLM